MSIINTNVLSINSQRNLIATQSALSQAVQRLSSGLRINSAKDDAAGLAISSRFTTQIRGLNQAVRNANDAISLSQTAEGALGAVSNNLQRIRELAVQSRNATNSASDRQALQNEVSQLKDEIQRVAEQTNFNGRTLLDGSFTAQAFQVGANQGDLISVAATVNTQISALGTRAQTTTVSGVAPTGFALGADPIASEFQLGAFTAGSDPDGAAVVFEIDFSATEDGAIAIAGSAVTIQVLGAVNASTLAEAFAAQESEMNDAGYTYSTGGDSIEDAIAGGSFRIVRADGGETDAVVGTNTGYTTPPALAAGTEPVNGTYSDPSRVFTKLDGTGLTFTLNDVVVAVAAGAVDAAAQTTAVIAAINDVEDETGIRATLNDDGGITLTTTSEDGIQIGGAGNDLILALTGLDTDDSVAGSVLTGFADLDVSTTEGADDAIAAMDAALQAVNSARAALGAYQNRFESVVSNLQTTAENLTASRSRIMDADFAAETAALSRAQILQQAGVAMVAQANQLPQGILALLR